MRNIIYIFVLFFSLITNELFGQNTMASPVDLGTKSISFTYTDTKNTTNYTNNYTGRSTNDVFYKFTTTVTMDVIISHCGSAVADTYVYLLNSAGAVIVSNDDYSGEGCCTTTTQSYLKKISLPAGTYYVVSEGFSLNGNITTSIQGIVPKLEYDLGQKNASFLYTHTQNTTNSPNSYTGRSTNDVFYKFTTTVAMDVIISHCGSAIADTYVYLLNSSGTLISSNDDYNGEGCCTTTTQSYLKKTSLPAGTYYVVSEGFSLNGNITTSIQGIMPKLEYDLGQKNASFLYTHTQNTTNSPNSYTGRSTNDVFYKFTTTVTMDVIISHCGSAVADTYVYLLNSAGVVIAYNDDYSGEGCCTTTTQSFLKTPNLAAGTYYVVSEGYSQNGEITTKIEGITISIGPSVDRNYIQTKTYTSEDSSHYIESIQYLDGLGHPVQMVQRGITPNGADLVTHQEYDSFGRESTAWLPAIAIGNDGGYIPLTTFKSKALSTYSNDSAYSRPVYEASPLSRIKEQYSPGKEWYVNKRAARIEYFANISGNDTLNCILYSVADTGDTILTVTRMKNYDTSQLSIIRSTDEDGNTAFEFKNKLGQVVLTRQIIRSGSAKNLHDTYYVYDDYGNLKVVLPPLASDQMKTGTSWSNTANPSPIRDYAFLYKYDNRNRCIRKCLPGARWVYYTYDKADQLIYTQDGEQKTKSPQEWTYSIPDALGRIVLTGICKDTISISNKVVKAEFILSGTYKRYNIKVDGVIKQFSNTPSILLVSYYDNYDFRGMTEIPANTETEYNVETGYGTWYGGDYTEANKYKNNGLLTGTLTAQQLSDGTISSTYLYSVMYYDNRRRLIQTKSNNHLSGGIEKEYITYNFTGQPTGKIHIHQATGKATQKEIYAYHYDHASRLLTTTHQLTDGATVNQPVILSENSYDELGRLLVSKKGVAADTQSTYTYNVRSWTKSITSNQFTENLQYAYSGNISQMQWTTAGQTRKYDFTYDALSRLKTATYTGIGNEQYGTVYNYDKHGNILTLQSSGKKDAGTTSSSYGLVDNLTMTYAGNQLIHAADAVTNFAYIESADFKDKVSAAGTVEYTYNANGAMKSDLNKGINEIQYNSLNLPRQMVINSPTVKAKNYYTYSASGVKLKIEQRHDPNFAVTPSIATNPTNDGLSDYKNTDYVGNIIYETTKNSTTVTNKTRILVDGGYYEDGIYYYYVADHLGNNRLVIKADGSIIQRNHYYPFGTAFAETPVAEQGKQPYKYNGKELDAMHQLNLYDYSARYYESAIGRFTSIDPLSELYYAWSPYSYVGNNPLRRTDATGMYWVNEDDAKFANRLSKDMSNRINSYQNEIDKLTAKMNKDKAKGKDITEYTTEIASLQESIDDLNGGISELTAMGKDKDQGFAYSKTSSNIGGAVKRADGIIEMEIAGYGSTVNGVHESAHGYDLWKEGIMTRENFGPREIKAYGRQFSYDKSSLPNSYWGSLTTRSDITTGWVWGAYNEVSVQNSMGGTTVMRNYLYSNKLLEGSRVQYSPAAVEKLLDQRRKSGMP